MTATILSFARPADIAIPGLIPVGDNGFDCDFAAEFSWSFVIPPRAKAQEPRTLAANERTSFVRPADLADDIRDACDHLCLGQGRGMRDRLATAAFTVQAMLAAAAEFQPEDAADRSEEVLDLADVAGEVLHAAEAARTFGQSALRDKMLELWEQAGLWSRP